MALVLTFIVAKMLVAHWYHVPVAASLTIVAVLIGASIIASLVATREVKNEVAGRIFNAHTRSRF